MPQLREPIPAQPQRTPATQPWRLARPAREPADTRKEMERFWAVVDGK